jgi:hypothetical protein
MPKDLKTEFGYSPQIHWFDSNRWIQIKSEKKYQESVFLISSHSDLIWSHFNLKKRPLDVSEWVSEWVSGPGRLLLGGVFWPSRLGRQIVSVRARVKPLGDPHSRTWTQAAITSLISMNHWKSRYAMHCCMYVSKLHFELKLSTPVCVFVFTLTLLVVFSVTDLSSLRLQDSRCFVCPDNFRMNTGMVDMAPLIIWLL